MTWERFKCALLRHRQTETWEGRDIIYRHCKCGYSWSILKWRMPDVIYSTLKIPCE